MNSGTREFERRGPADPRSGAGNVTQPAVTLHVQALEAQYGLTLFNRGKTGVTLTRDGEELYKLTARMFADEADIAAFLDGPRRSNTGIWRFRPTARM